MASFRILGPIEAWNGERKLPLGGQRQLGLLAFWCSAPAGLPQRRAVGGGLGVRSLGSRQSSSDGGGPAAPRTRSAGGRRRATLRTVGGGYLLAVAPANWMQRYSGSVKHDRTALESGQHARAAELSCAALELWRGPPLAEVAFEDFAQAEIRRLEELRLTALERRIDADLRLGRHHELVGELDALVLGHSGASGSLGS